MVSYMENELGGAQGDMMDQTARDVSRVESANMNMTMERRGLKSETEQMGRGEGGGCLRMSEMERDSRRGTEGGRGEGRGYFTGIYFDNRWLPLFFLGDVVIH